MCPVCTVTVIAGLGISRLLGIDDVITSIWIGGFILSFSFITVTWLEKSKWRKSIYKLMERIKCSMTEHSALNLITISSMYGLVIIPLLANHTIGIKRNTLWGVDKIIVGITVGTIVFLIGIWADKKVRKLRGGKQLFEFQKVIFPVLTLIIASFIFWLLIK